MTLARDSLLVEYVGLHRTTLIRSAPSLLWQYEPHSARWSRSINDTRTFSLRQRETTCPSFRPRKTARLMPLLPGWPPPPRRQRSSPGDGSKDGYQQAAARFRSAQARPQRLFGDCSSIAADNVCGIDSITIGKLAMDPASLLAASICRSEQRDWMALMKVIEAHGRAPRRKRELGGLSAARKPTGESTRDGFF